MDKHIEVGGHKFKVVKNGLDASQVASFIETLRGPDFDIEKRLERLDSLIEKVTEHYNLLAGRMAPADSESGPSEDDSINIEREKLSHLDSLTRLAQRTVVEAEKEAESIRSDRCEEAQASAHRIVSEAEDKARSILEEAKARAQEEALAVKEEIEQLLARSRQSLEGEIRGMFDKATQHLLADLPNAATAQFDTVSDQDKTPDPSQLEDVAYAQAEAPEESGGQPAAAYEEHPLIYADPYEDTVEYAVGDTIPDPQ